MILHLTEPLENLSVFLWENESKKDSLTILWKPFWRCDTLSTPHPQKGCGSLDQIWRAIDSMYP